MLRKAIAVSLIVLFAVPWIVWAGSLEIRRYLLIAGDCDSTTQLTRWIPVKGATRIRIRTFSSHLAAGINADTTKTDSIASFFVQFSDSISAYVTGPENQTVAVGADSFQLTNGQFDTSTVSIGVYPNPTNKPLRAPANGSGIITQIYPIGPGPVAPTTVDYDGFISKEQMRILFTPSRRNTAGGQLSTQGIRTNGLRGIKMVAEVYYKNK